MTLKLLNIAGNLSSITKMRHEKKEKSESCFDIMMGSNDGAEICELNGIYTLLQLSNLVPQEDWLIPG